MLLREALARVQAATFSDERQVAVVCSFEPLHLVTFVQAQLAARRTGGAATPRVVSFGYDQLARGLAETAGALRYAPTLLALTWEDWHPALSWRSRTGLAELSAEAVQARAAELETRLRAWVRARGLSQTVVAPPPIEWLPWCDPTPPGALGPTAAAAMARMWTLACNLIAEGAKVLMPSSSPLDLRQLLQAGCPLRPEESDQLAARFVEAIEPPSARTKGIVVDLDGTLWHGVLAEDGPEGIAAHEGKGGAFQAFQRFLAKLQAEGILLAFCSKNNAEDVLPVFDRLAMPLRLGHFAAHRCDWEPKAANVRAIADELGIHWQDLIVIDDSDVELMALRRALPGLTALRTPAGGDDWLRLFAELQRRCGAWRLGEEDRVRTATVRRRQPALATPSSTAGMEPSVEDLRALALRVSVNRRAFADARSLELVNKTNQFNLTGRRWAPEAWAARADDPAAWCRSARLQDRDGDFGTICVALGRGPIDGVLELEQLVLSCRAFGRAVEQVMVLELLQDGSWRTLRGPFIDTGRNEPAKRFLAALGIAVNGAAWEIARAAIEPRVPALVRAAGIEVFRADDDASVAVSMRAGVPVHG